jgi:hypothetical protein
VSIHPQVHPLKISFRVPLGSSLLSDRIRESLARGVHLLDVVMPPMNKQRIVQPGETTNNCIQENENSMVATDAWLS